MKHYKIFAAVVSAWAGFAYPVKAQLTEKGYVLSDGAANTAMGQSAMDVISSGGGAADNTAGGYRALSAITTGMNNTAFGAFTAQSITTSGGNSAFGYEALDLNSGNNNTAIGGFAMAQSDGNNDTAVGTQALYFNSGDDNTAIGFSALENSTGSYNTASGYEALYRNRSGRQNTATGVYALHDNTSGFYNTASGDDALYNNSSGSSNIAEGYKAGFNLTTGSDNIDIGSQGVAAESGIIRIGTSSTHTAAYIAGIASSGVTGAAVLVNTKTGQLGVASSSRRYKQDIQPIGDASERLFALQPVSFRYKEADANGEKRIQYGLVAEDVAKTFPELVVSNQQGQPETVAYHELPALLLNELKKERAELGALKVQTSEIKALRAEVAELRRAQLASSATP